MEKTLINKLLKTFKQGNSGEVAKILKQNYFDINTLNRTKETSLVHEVSEKGYNLLLNNLLDYGINLNLENKYGITPAHLACTNGCFEVLKILFENDIDPFLNLNGLSLLHYAATNNSTDNIALLLEKGIDVNVKTKDSDFWTPVFYSIQEEKLIALEFMLKNGADVNHVDGNGFTVLHHAAGIKNINIAKILLKYGSKINYLTAQGTPLHIACAWDNAEVVKLLLHNGVDKQLKDDEGLCAIDIAKANTNNNIIQLLG